MMEEKGKTTVRRFNESLVMSEDGFGRNSAGQNAVSTASNLTDDDDAVSKAPLSTNQLQSDRQGIILGLEILKNRLDGLGQLKRTMEVDEKQRYSCVVKRLHSAADEYTQLLRQTRHSASSSALVAGRPRLTDSNPLLMSHLHTSTPEFGSLIQLEEARIGSGNSEMIRDNSRTYSLDLDELRKSLQNISGNGAQKFFLEGDEEQAEWSQIGEEEGGVALVAEEDERLLQSRLSAATSTSSAAVRLNDSQRKKLADYGAELRREMASEQAELKRCQEAKLREDRKKRNKQRVRCREEFSASQNDGIGNPRAEEETMGAYSLSTKAVKKTQKQNFLPGEQKESVKENMPAESGKKDKDCSSNDLAAWRARLASLRRRVEAVTSSSRVDAVVESGTGPKMEIHANLSSRFRGRVGRTPTMSGSAKQRKQLPAGRDSKSSVRRPRPLSEDNVLAADIGSATAVALLPPFLTASRPNGVSHSVCVNLQQLLSSLKVLNPELHSVALSHLSGDPTSKEITVPQLANILQQHLQHCLDWAEQRLERHLLLFDELQESLNRLNSENGSETRETTDAKREVLSSRCGELQLTIQQQDTNVQRLADQLLKLNSLLEAGRKKTASCRQPVCKTVGRRKTASERVMRDTAASRQRRANKAPPANRQSTPSAAQLRQLRQLQEAFSSS